MYYILLEYSLGHITLLFRNITNLNETHPMRGLVTNFKIELDLMNASQTFCTWLGQFWQDLYCLSIWSRSQITSWIQMDSTGKETQPGMSTNVQFCNWEWKPWIEVICKRNRKKKRRNYLKSQLIANFEHYKIRNNCKCFCVDIK